MASFQNYMYEKNMGILVCVKTHLTRTERDVTCWPTSCQNQNKVLRVHSAPCCRGDSERWGGSDVKCVHYSGTSTDLHISMHNSFNLTLNPT